MGLAIAAAAGLGAAAAVWLVAPDLLVRAMAFASGLGPWGATTIVLACVLICGSLLSLALLRDYLPRLTVAYRVGVLGAILASVAFNVRSFDAIDAGDSWRLKVGQPAKLVELAQTSLDQYTNLHIYSALERTFPGRTLIASGDVLFSKAITPFRLAALTSLRLDLKRDVEPLRPDEFLLLNARGPQVLPNEIGGKVWIVADAGSAGPICARAWEDSLVFFPTNLPTCEPSE